MIYLNPHEQASLICATAGLLNAIDLQISANMLIGT